MPTDPFASLKGHVAIVTGSTSGIGQALAHALAAEGVGIVLNGFGDAGRSSATAPSLAEQHGVAVRYHGADMTKPAEIADMVAFASAISAGWTSWSITPASSTSRRSRTFRSTSGTRSSPSTCPRPSTPFARPCRS